MKPPRCKRRPPNGYIPFPINIPNETTAAKTGHHEQLPQLRFEGVVTKDGEALISSPGDMAILYNMGFFGQGTLSRHEPVFHTVVEQNVDFIKHHLQSSTMGRYCHKNLGGSVEVKPKVTRQVSPDGFLRAYQQYEADAHNCGNEDVAMEGVSTDSHKHGYMRPSDDQTILDCESQFKTAERAKSEYHSTSYEDSQGSTILVTSIPLGSLNLSTAPPNTQPIAGQPDITQLSCQTSKETDWDAAEADTDFWSSDALPSTSNWGERPETPVTILSSASGDVPQPTEPALLTGSDELAEADTTQGKNRLITSPTQSLGDSSGIDSSDEEYIPLNDLELNDSEDKSEYYKMTEQLRLDAFETLFLMICFNSLVLYEEDTKTPLLACVAQGFRFNHSYEAIEIMQMAIMKQHIDTYDTLQERVLSTEVWRRAICKDKSFIPRYAVYHHIRAKGWIVKSGLTYGCDFMVYKKGPRYYHSSLGVLVRCCDQTTLQETPEYNPRHITWAKLMGVNRVINNVRKELMICYALIPPDLDTSAPVECIKQIAICETLITRVNPERERDAFNSTDPSAKTCTKQQPTKTTAPQISSRKNIQDPSQGQQVASGDSIT